jgi:hypothetical protein
MNYLETINRWNSAKRNSLGVQNISHVHYTKHEHCEEVRLKSTGS